MAHHFGLMKVSDLILLNDKGEAIGGNTSLPTNAAGFQIHEHIHRAFPHVNAACHAHSVNGRAWSSFGRRLDMIHQDVCNFYGDAHQVYSDFGGVVLDPKEGERLARTLGPNGKGLILQNHGLLTVGKTIDEAAYLFCLLETCCEIQLKVEAAAASGLQRVLVRGDSAVFTYETTSNPVCFLLFLFLLWVLLELTLCVSRRACIPISNRIISMSWLLLMVPFWSNLCLVNIVLLLHVVSRSPTCQREAYNMFDILI